MTNEEYVSSLPNLACATSIRRLRIAQDPSLMLTLLCLGPIRPRQYYSSQVDVPLPDSSVRRARSADRRSSSSLLL